MRDILFPFQETALSELHDKINKAHLMWSERDPQIISFSAPTGSGKTIIMTTLLKIYYMGMRTTLENQILFSFGFPIHLSLTSKQG